MTSKAAGTVAVLLLASLACLGVVSCSRDSLSEPIDSGSPNAPDGLPQTAGEDEYGIEIAAIAVVLGAIVRDLDGPLTNPETENDDWNTAVSLALLDIVALCDEVSRIVPSDSMANTHMTNLEAMDRLNDAVGLLARAIGEADVDAVNQACTEMWLATEILSEVADSSE